MMVQKLHWNGQPRPASKQRVMADDPPHHFFWQHGYRGGLHARHVMEVIVEGLRLAGVDVAEKIGHPPLALARVKGHAERLRLFQIRRQFRQHRDAARDVEAADHDRNVELAEGASEVDRARKLIDWTPTRPTNPPPPALIRLAIALTSMILLHSS